MALPSSRQEFWKPRYYYVMKNKTSGKFYFGQTTGNIDTYLGSGVYWKNHCKTHGGYSKSNIEVTFLEYFELKETAEKFISSFEANNPNYWIKENTLWANLCKENTDDNPFYDGTISKENNKLRVENGTHIFLKENRKPSMNQTQIGTKIFKDNLLKLYGVDNIMKDETIAKRAGKTQSKTKSNPEWKQTVEPLRVQKMNNTLSKLEKNGKTKKENRNKKIGEKNKVHNEKRVKEGKHQYQNGFYGILENGSSKWISSEEYKNRKSIGCLEYVHPTSIEGKKRRSAINAVAV